jgi:hypothetical protein
MNSQFLILNFRKFKIKNSKFKIALFVFICGQIVDMPVFADTPTPSPTPASTPSPTPTATRVLTPSVQTLPKVTTIPNPARGNKMTFRIMTAGPAKARIRIYDRFMDPVAEPVKEGNKLFDILWSLKDVPEGIYCYQAQIEDTTTGEITKLPQQKFVVLK